MVLKFLLLLFPAILLYIPMAFYKKTGNCMTAFYYRMAFSENTRKFYMLTLLIILLLFHYLHHSVMNDIVTLIPSTALSMCLFSYRLTDRLFYLIRSRLDVCGYVIGNDIGDCILSWNVSCCSHTRILPPCVHILPVPKSSLYG